MGHHATSINLLAFSVAILSQKSCSLQQETGTQGQVPSFVGQVVSECTVSLNGLTGFLLDQNKVQRLNPIWTGEGVAK